MNKFKNILLNICVFFSYFIFLYVPSIIVIGFNIQDNLYRQITLIVTSLFYLLLLIFIYKKELKEDIKKLKLINIVKYIPIYLLGILLMALSNNILSNYTNMDISTNESSVRQILKILPIYMSFSIVIYSPFVEEMIFRKVIRLVFKNKYIFIILSGLIFGFIHMSYFNVNELLMCIPYIIMGIDFAYIYYKSDNIFTTITLHSIHNLILLIIQFVMGG